jgi:hypothetical protein
MFLSSIVCDIGTIFFPLVFHGSLSGGGPNCVAIFL